MTGVGASRDAWPALPLEAWADTCATLHLWMQIAGKIRLAQSPWMNHGWHATLYPTATGLTTSLIPYRARAFQIDFDFLAHRLTVQSSDGGLRLRTMSSASQLLAPGDAVWLEIDPRALVPLAGQ